jgi:DNA-binding MarR family transcriptional regulator
MGSPQTISDIESHLGFWLRFVSNHVSHAFAARLAGRGVTVAEWVMLRTLYGAEDMAPSRVAETMGMTRGAISKLAERLLAKGLIARRENPGDRRGQMLTLTQQGTALLPELAALADANDEAFFSHLSAQERALLRNLMQHLVTACGMREVPVN